MKYGYARTSTTRQNLDLQLFALQKAGCDQIFSEQRSAYDKKRIINSIVEKLMPGDELVVWKADRAHRDNKSFFELLDSVKARGAKLISLTQEIDMSSADGVLTTRLVAALAEHERNKGRERVLAGMKRYIERGGKLGRPTGLTEQQVLTAKKAKKLMDDGWPQEEILKMLTYNNKQTLYNHLKVVGWKKDRSHIEARA